MIAHSIKGSLNRNFYCSHEIFSTDEDTRAFIHCLLDTPSFIQSDSSLAETTCNSVTETYLPI